MLVLAMVAAIQGTSPVVVGTLDHGTAKVIVLARDREAMQTLSREFEVVRKFLVLEGFVARVGAAQFKKLANDPRVKSVELDRRLRVRNDQAATLTGAASVSRELGYVGRGVRIAVLDTGVERTNPDLIGAIAAERCFVTGGCPPSNADIGELAPDVSGHGTHICGTITGDGVVAPRGIAPGSQVIVVRVFDATSFGLESDWAIALDWVLSQREALGIRLVNLSLGTDDSYPGNCDSAWPAMGDAVARLRAAGVTSFAAAGNEYVDGGLNAPACLSGAISVGAVYDADLGREPDNGTYASGCVDANADAGTVMCFSNSSNALDLLGPGSRIRSSGLNGTISERRGTSQATAHVTAIAALMLEADPTLGPDSIEEILESSGRGVRDPKNGVVTPLVDAVAALARVRATQCARRTEGAMCELTRACDAGVCTSTNGVCAASQCVQPMITEPTGGGSGGGGGEQPGCSTTPLAMIALALILLSQAGRGDR